MLNFIKTFFSSIEMIMWFLFFSLLIWCITSIDLCILKNPCIPGINPNWSSCMILYCIVGIGLLVFWWGFLPVEVHQWYWPVIFSFYGILVCFWYQCVGGLIECNFLINGFQCGSSTERKNLKMDRLFELLSYFSFSVNKLELNVGSKGRKEGKNVSDFFCWVGQIASSFFLFFCPPSWLMNLKNSLLKCWIDRGKKNLRANCLTSCFLPVFWFFLWTKKDLPPILCSETCTYGN